MSSISVSMPYITNLSVGHYTGARRGGGRYTLPEVRAWKDELAIKVRNQTNLRGLHPLPPITITLRAYYPNLRAVNDGDNLGKVICDAVQDAWLRPDWGGPLINDRKFNFASLGYEIDAKNPHLEIEVSWNG